MKRLPSKLVRTAPKRIWLQCGDDPENLRCNFIEMGDVTWCKDSVMASEVEYIRADLSHNVQAETAAQAAQLPTGWPRASISVSRLGWTLDYKFLQKVEQLAKSRTEFSTSMEATEQVLIAALEVLATAAIDAASVAKEGQKK